MIFLQKKQSSRFWEIEGGLREMQKYNQIDFKKPRVFWRQVQTEKNFDRIFGLKLFWVEIELKLSEFELCLGW